RREVEGLCTSAAVADALARAHAGLGPILQGRRAVLLQLQRRRAVRRVDGARRHRVPSAGKAGMGQQESPLHQQRRSEQVREARVPEGLGIEGVTMFRRDFLQLSSSLALAAPGLAQDQPMTVRDFLGKLAYTREDVSIFLDPAQRNWAKFDPELGYLLQDGVLHDGVDGARTVLSFG